MEPKSSFASPFLLQEWTFTSPLIKPLKAIKKLKAALELEYYRYFGIRVMIVVRNMMSSRGNKTEGDMYRYKIQSVMAADSHYTV